LLSGQLNKHNFQIIFKLQAGVWTVSSWHSWGGRKRKRGLLTSGQTHTQTHTQFGLEPSTLTGTSGSFGAKCEKSRRNVVI